MTKSNIDKNIDRIATVLLAQSDCQSNDLVALIGKGNESSNHQALVSWLVARFEHIDTVELTAQEAATKLTGYLQEQYSLRDQKCTGGMLDVHSVLPEHSLTVNECRSLSRAIYNQLSTTVNKSILDMAICLGESAHADPIECIYEWVQQRRLTYTFYPAELALPLSHAFASTLEERCSFHDI
ncbi:hypothetical protein [Zhongshania aquimaris]|uniref:Uncharacterized protein n=1 Tax=Zhongshania aquimaris TaxID=2857107 RepID=A0ABS6VST9_9GAMM|nr:hypothetical protein [Zhongshania aquimaris]MBW2941377.1 hypothetical protein [Zhongshania aquimaris]